MRRRGKTPEQRRLAAVNRQLRSLRSRPHFHQTAAGRARIERDLRLITDLFPALRYEVDAHNTAMLAGPITIDLGNETYRSVRLRIEFPHNYPDGEPRVFDADKHFAAHDGHSLLDRHISENGWFCLWLPPLSKWDRSNPSALLDFLGHVALFVHRQFIYDIIGSWPGEQWAHSTDGWIEFIHQRLDEICISPKTFCAGLRSGFPGRKAACICGSGRLYIECHRSAINKLVEQIDDVLLAKIRGNEINI